MSNESFRLRIGKAGAARGPAFSNKQKIMSKTIIYILLTLFSFSAIAQEKTLPLDPAVRTGRLANGFTYYIRHNEVPKNRVVMYLVNKAGSVLEEEDQRGLAHFMEHMEFNGTLHFPHNQLVDYLQRAGLRFGADINAYTSFDETVYQLPLPSDKPGILDTGILIMHDWAQSALLDPVEIDKERGVVLEEKRLGKGAAERMQRQYWPVLLNHSRYAFRVPIGLDTVLDNFKRPQIYRFYHDWYRPDLQALIIVGDVNADSLVRVIKSKFSDLKNPVHEKPRPSYTVPLLGKNQFMVVTDKEMTQTVAEVIIKHKAIPLKTAAQYRAHIITDLFNQLLAARYNELSRKGDVPFADGGAGFSGFMGGLDIYDASVAAKAGQLEQGFKAVWRETERVKRFGFTPTELERAKAEYLSEVKTRLDEKDKINSDEFVRVYQQYFLKGTAAPGIAAAYATTEADLRGITQENVNELTKTITATNRDILIEAPEKDKNSLPDEATVNRWIAAVQAENLQPYQDAVSSQPLISEFAAPGKIISEQKNEKLNMISLTLSNGLKVILKPTDFKNDEIKFTGFAPGGSSLYSDADYQSAANAAGIIGSGGAGNYDAGQLDKFLAGKQLQVQPYISDRFQGMSGVSASKDLETALQLVYARFTAPRKDTAVFQAILSSSKAALANRGSDPSSVFKDTVSAVLGNYNIRRTGPSVAKLDEINLDRACIIYKELFADAANFTFTFAGSIDTTTIKPLLEKYLGSLPATHTNEQAKDLGIHAPAGVITKTVHKGSESKSTVLLVFSGPFAYNQQNNIALDALRETLEIRLLERLREDESGVYSPGVYATTTKSPRQRYSFIVQFGCAPQNVDKLIHSALDEISKLKTSGPLQENLDKWRAEDKSERETEWRTNEFWLGYLTNQLQNDESLEQVTDYPVIRDAITTSELQALAAKYLDGSNFIRLVLLPE